MATFVEVNASMAYGLAVLSVGGGAGAAAGFFDELMWPIGTIPHRSAAGGDFHDPSRGIALLPNGPVATKGALVLAGQAVWAAPAGTNATS
jgi:hypothetical protein